MDCNPSNLVQAARCYCGFSKRHIDSALTYLACAWANAGSRTSALLEDWLERIQTAGGAEPSAKTKNAINTFALGLEDSGFYHKLLAVNCFAPDNLTAALTPLIANVGRPSWVHTGFLPGDISLAGLKGNGSSKYVSTGIIPSLVFAGDYNSAGLSVYNTFSSTSDGHDLGVFSDVPFKLFDLLVTTSITGQIEFYCWGTTTGNVRGPGLPGGVGFSSGSRTAANAIASYIASSTHPFSQVFLFNGAPEADYPNRELYAFAANSFDAPFGGTYSERCYSFMAVHTGLTQAETQQLYNLVQQMRQDLGGGFA